MPPALFQDIDGNPYILGLSNTHPELVPAGWKPCPASQAAIPELVGRINCTSGALVQERTNTGYSDYNGLQIELRSASLWNQLTLQSSYTFSKTTDNTTEIGATGSAGNTSHLSQSQVNFTGQEHGLPDWISRTNSCCQWLKRYRFSKIAAAWLGGLWGGGAPLQLTFCLQASHTRRSNSPSAVTLAATSVPLRQATPILTIPTSMRSTRCRMVRCGLSGVEQRPGAIGRNFRQGYLLQRWLWNSVWKPRDLPDHADQPQPVQYRFHRHEPEWLRSRIP